MAVQNFHSTHNRLPSQGNDPLWEPPNIQRSDGSGVGSGAYSPLVTLLPFYEQDAIYSEIMAACQAVASGVSGAGIPGNGGGNYNPGTGNRNAPTSVRLAVLLCPTDSVYDKGTPPTGNTSPTPDGGRSSYRFNNGDTVIEPRAGSTTATTRGAFAYTGTGTNYQVIDFDSVRDGISNSLALSESAISRSSDQDTDYRSALVSFCENCRGGSNSTDTGDTTFGGGGGGQPKKCGDARGANFQINFINAQWRSRNKGFAWGHSHSRFTAFMAALPPNSPSCATNTRSDGNSQRLISATSYHAGGVNVTFLDASGRFISETIESGNPVLIAGQDRDGNWLPGNDQSVPGRYGGPSPYGVWGAMGTISGGESVAAP